MIFSSNLFLFGFLPLFLACYYLTPLRFRSAVILAFSYAFYGWWRWDFLALLVAASVISYAFALAIDASHDEQRRRQLLTLAVSGNLAALAYFKYANFGVDSLNAVLLAAGMQPFGWAAVVLPIGLSFYLFHAISYLVDIYRREAPPARNLIDFSAFIALFPHLVAGPVLRYHLLAQQFARREHSWANFARGSQIFMLGFCKKVLIADSIVPLVDAGFAASGQAQGASLLDAWSGALCYTLQLFFDFSGYTDMAIGLALMIGFVFPQNFNDPYLSFSITEFWKRWHMSLSNWLREYLYISLGGNRHGRARTYLNLFLTMLLGGLWHGANWTFVLWGAWHGGWLAVERWLGERFGPSRLPGWLRLPKTLLLVIIGWVIFRAANMTEALHMLAGMIGLHGIGFSPSVAWQITPDRVAVFVLGWILVFAAPAIKRHANEAWRLMLIPLFLWAVATLSAQAYSPFLYFQF
jgi:alginate O-acetyltransferase complex protein AlgI